MEEHAMKHPLTRIFAPITLIVAIAASSFTMLTVDKAEQLATMTSAPAMETTVARAHNP